MADQGQAVVDVESAGKPRTIHRSRPFFVAPLILIVALSINLVWEMIRQNVDDQLRSEWPLHFSLLNVTATATAWTAFVALFMARLQWARSLRPHLGWAIQDHDAEFSPTSEVWYIWLHNAGPGLALVSEIRYQISMSDQPKLLSDWLTVNEASKVIAGKVFAIGTDFFIREHAGPVSAVPAPTSGRDIARFDVKVLANLAVFNVRVRYADTLGESYELVLPTLTRLPTVTAEAIEAYRNRVPTP